MAKTRGAARLPHFVLLAKSTLFPPNPSRVQLCLVLRPVAVFPLLPCLSCCRFLPVPCENSEATSGLSNAVCCLNLQVSADGFYFFFSYFFFPPPPAKFIAAPQAARDVIFTGYFYQRKILGCLLPYEICLCPAGLTVGSAPQHNANIFYI